MKFDVMDTIDTEAWRKGIIKEPSPEKKSKYVEKRKVRKKLQKLQIVS